MKKPATPKTNKAAAEPREPYVPAIYSTQASIALERATGIRHGPPTPSIKPTTKAAD